MHKYNLFCVLMLVSSLLTSQPDRSPSAVKTNDDFSRFIIEKIKAGSFSSVYQHLQPEIDTLKLGQTLSRYAFQINKPEYKVVSKSHGWAGADLIYRAMYYNSWKINGEEKFSIEIWFYKKKDLFVIDRLNFSSTINELYSPEAIAADSLSKVVLKSIESDNYMAVYNLYKPGVKIDKEELARIVHAYAKIITDTSLKYRHSGIKTENFPVRGTNWALYNYNYWETAPYIVAVEVDVEVIEMKGKYYVAKIKFLSDDEKAESFAFPGGKLYFDSEVAPPPPFPK